MSVVFSGVSIAQWLGWTALVFALLLGSALLAGVYYGRPKRGLTLKRNDLPIWWFDRGGRPVPVHVANTTPRAPPVAASRDPFPGVPDPTIAYRCNGLFPGDQS